MPTYSDVTLGEVNENPSPVVADGNGRWPQVYFDNVSDRDPITPDVQPRTFYDVRVTDAAGVELYYDRGVPIIGPSTGGGGGGGGGPPVDQKALFQTGDTKTRFGSGFHDGWVRMQGGTINNSGGSGASERADPDTQHLYEYLWNNFSFPSGNKICPVVGTLGGSALADFNSGTKPLTLPDMRGRVAAGADTPAGSSPAGLIKAAYMDTIGTGTGAYTPTPDVVGGYGGDDEIILTDIKQVPAHRHSAQLTTDTATTPAFTKMTAANHGHPWQLSANAGSSSESTGGGLMIAEDGASPDKIQPAYTGTPSHILGQEIGGSGLINVTGDTTEVGGIGTGATPKNSSPHENLQPFMLLTYYIKL